MLLAVPYDLVILDEAHHLKRQRILQNCRYGLLFHQKRGNITSLMTHLVSIVQLVRISGYIYFKTILTTEGKELYEYAKEFIKLNAMIYDIKNNQSHLSGTPEHCGSRVCDGKV